MTARRIARKITLTLFCLTIVPLPSGCLVGPNFHRPSLKTPPAWIGEGETSSTLAAGPAVELGRWWEAFRDSTLNRLIRRGITSNLDVQLAVQRVRQARAVLGESQAGLWPTLDFSSSFQRTTTRLPKPSGSSASSGGTGTGSGGAAVTGFNRNSSKSSYRAGFDSAWELDLFGGTRRGIEASRADLFSSEESLRNALVTLTAEIGGAYMTLRTQQEQLRITRENLDIQKGSAAITIKRREVGFASGLDQANAESIVASTSAQIPNLESQIRQTIYQLSLLLGEEPGALVEELTPHKPFPTPPGTIPAQMPGVLLERRPDIRAAEASLHAATARIGVAVAALFPSITLSANAGAQASQLGSWSHNVTSTYSYGPSANWNIFSGGLLWNRVRANRAAADQALTQYQQAVLTALGEVETAWTAFNHEIDRGRSLEVAVASNQRALKLSTQLYTEGQTEFLSVLVAEQALLNSQNSLIQSRGAVANDLITLYKALGGGWSDEAAMDATANTPAVFWKN